MSKPALCATSTSAPAKAARSSSCSLQVLALHDVLGAKAVDAGVQLEEPVVPGGGWISHPAVATTRPSRTRASPTAQADALLEFAVSKSIAVKSRGTPPESPARERAGDGGAPGAEAAGARYGA